MYTYIIKKKLPFLTLYLFLSFHGGTGFRRNKKTLRATRDVNLWRTMVAHIPSGHVTKNMVKNLTFKMGSFVV